MSFVSRYPSTHSDTYVKATSYNGTTYPHLATDQALSLTGASATTEWLSGGTAVQKFSIDYGTAFIATRLYLENSHDSGASVNRGIHDFIVYGTNSATAFAETSYASTTDLVELETLNAVEHTAVDEADPQYFDITNTTAYQYYIIRIGNSWGGFMSIRHIAFQEEVEDITGILSLSGYSSTFASATAGNTSGPIDGVMSLYGANTLFSVEGSSELHLTGACSLFDATGTVGRIGELSLFGKAAIFSATGTSDIIATASFIGAKTLFAADGINGNIGDLSIFGSKTIFSADGYFVPANDSIMSLHGSGSVLSIYGAIINTESGLFRYVKGRIE